MSNFANDLWDFAKAIPPVASTQAILNTLADQRRVKQPCSLMALKSVDTVSIGDKILLELYHCKQTDDSLEVKLEMRHQTVSACRRGLVKKELVEATGDTKPTRSGRKANVWECTRQGIDRVGMLLDKIG
tara:strand:- start:32 stop:421 length:390 start_codon:yes stop_codon:yes gene_type:complete